MEITWVPSILLELGLPTKNRPKHGVWKSKCGVRVQGTHGVPYGADRFILLYLASEAVQQGHHVRGHLQDIMKGLGLGIPLERTRERLLRIVGMWYERHRGQEVCSRHHQIVERFAWCDSAQTEYELTLTDSFVKSARTGASCSMAIIRKLCHRIADVDLYLWMAWQSHGREQRILPAMGPHGPYGMLASAVDPYKCRQLIRERLHRIRRAWPACPYRLSQDRTRFVDDSRRARTGDQVVRPHREGSSKTTEPTARQRTGTTRIAAPSPTSTARRTRSTLQSQAQARAEARSSMTIKPAARGSPRPGRRHSRKVIKRRHQRTGRKGHR
jgi:hypothetical protein